MASLLDRVSARSNDLSKGERKVAAAVLAQPQLTVTETIAQLAKRANVSEPTVSRFCKRFDGNGFPEFKLALNNSMNSEQHRLPDRVKSGDSVTDIVNKVIESTTVAMQGLSRTLDPSAIARCIDLISQARRIVILAQGLSTACAYDFHTRLAVMGIASEIYQDPSSMMLATTALRQGELALAISGSGQNRDVIAAAINAKKSGASVIALCPDNTSLAHSCILNLKAPQSLADSKDNMMVGRMVMQTILQIVLSGVMLRRSDTIRELEDRLQSSRSRSYLDDSLTHKDAEKEGSGESLEPDAPITSINWPAGGGM